MSNPRHGTSARYVAGCRCNECRRGYAEYQQDYRRRRRAELAASIDERRANKPTEWMLKANCRGTDPELFHPQRGDIKTLREAKAICRRCQVKAECLADAHTMPVEKLGIRGGYSEEERRLMRRAERLKGTA